MDSFLTFMEQHGIWASLFVALLAGGYKLTMRAIDKVTPVLQSVGEAHVQAIEEVSKANTINAETIRALGDSQLRIEGKIDGHGATLEQVKQHLEGLRRTSEH